MKQREDADQAPARQRIDKWLWAARFYKTRSLAAQAVESGKVRLGGGRVKPGKEVKPGDLLEVRVGELLWLIEIRAVSLRRGPATEAALLYAETDDSRERRERNISNRRLPSRAAWPLQRSVGPHNLRRSINPAIHGADFESASCDVIAHRHVADER